MATCPECDQDLDLDALEIDVEELTKGDVISCPECGSNLRVVDLAPLEFAVEDDDEDDEDDDEEFEDEDEADEDGEEEEEEGDDWEE